MINIRQQGNKKTAYLTEFVIDDINELIDVPKFPTVAYGSICFCIENNSIYILNGSNEYSIIEIKDSAVKISGELVQLLLGPRTIDSISGIMESEV